MTTLIGYDTEFLNLGSTLYPISIGLAFSTGIHYYAVNKDMPVRAIGANDFLMEHVWPQLPLDKNGNLDYRNTVVKSLGRIAEEIKGLLEAEENGWELVTYCGSQDGTIFGNLFSKGMWPEGWGWWVYDIEQERRRLGVELPEQTTLLHHALSDASYNLACRFWLDDLAAKTQVGR
ncbi:hypothetical protein AB0G15_05945 [Streptosporangium sp. NPDC023825]|uniref:hypothetical protein n=1 Tax=Streptosporangium sp. NPDC023825 TaxID=3154909 RepID=UPI003425CD7F